MVGSPNPSIADGGARLGRARTWLTKLARPAFAYTPGLAAVPDYLYRAAGDADTGDSDDDGTVYGGRERPVSRGSDGGGGGGGVSFDETDAGSDRVLDPARMDTAIAAMLRARQQDQLGNHECAARLFVTALERMSLAIRSPECVADSHSRERLAMLRLLIAAPDCVPDPAPLRAGEGAVCRAPPPAAAALAVGPAGPLADAAAYVLGLLTQIVVLLLVLLGNVVAWAALQFKNSTLPEAAASHLVALGAWAHTACQEHNIYTNAARLGRSGVAWLASVDRQAAFSQRLLCSSAAVLAAVARVAAPVFNGRVPPTRGHVHFHPV